MQITVTRNYKKPAYTIGRLYIDGAYICNTLEDTDRQLRQDMTTLQIRKLKIKGQTAIPTGTYEVTRTYSPRFKRQLPLVNNVPGFDGIRIHSGNTAKDTEGCILPGMNTRKGMVTDSRKWFLVIDDRIAAALKTGAKVWLKIE